MPEIVDDTKDELEGALVPGVAYGLGTGVGRSALGPVGHSAGAVIAGAYTGGQTGNAMSAIGLGEGIAMLMASSGNSGGSRGTM